MSLAILAFEMEFMITTRYIYACTAALIALKGILFIVVIICCAYIAYPESHLDIKLFFKGDRRDDKYDSFSHLTLRFCSSLHSH